MSMLFWGEAETDELSVGCFYCDWHVVVRSIIASGEALSDAPLSHKQARRPEILPSA